MAKTATSKGSSSGRSKAAKKSSSRAVTRRSGSNIGGGSGRGGPQENMGDAFIKLLQSPLVADLVAVAATAALAALAEHGLTGRGAGDSRRRDRAGKAVKEAGKAAAAAIGRRLSNELEEIRSASKKSKAGAGA